MKFSAPNVLTKALKKSTVLLVATGAIGLSFGTNACAAGATSSERFSQATSLSGSAFSLSDTGGGSHQSGLQSKATLGQPFSTALVDSCSDAWYWRSGIEELACGFSGQGWWN